MEFWFAGCISEEHGFDGELRSAVFANPHQNDAARLAGAAELPRRRILRLQLRQRRVHRSRRSDYSCCRRRRRRRSRCGHSTLTLTYRTPPARYRTLTSASSSSLSFLSLSLWLPVRAQWPSVVPSSHTLSVDVLIIWLSVCRPSANCRFLRSAQLPSFFVRSCRPFGHLY